MIIGIVGDMGSGKTLLMTALLMNDAKEGNKLYTNYNLLKNETTKLRLHEIKKLFTLELINKVSFGCDEMHIFMDSRSGARNRVISYWILQTRKRGIDLFYTTQYFHQIDRRLRDATLYKIECTNYGTAKEPDLSFELKKRIDVDSQEEWIHIKDFKINNIKKYYECFNTNEIINPFADEEDEKPDKK